MALYACQGIRDYWLVNLDEDHVEIYREPSPNGYGSRTVVNRGDTVTPMAFSDLSIGISELLGS